MFRRYCSAVIIAALPLISHAAPFAYVPNERSGTGSVTDTVPDQVVAAEGKNEMAVTDTTSDTIAFPIAVQGENPKQAAFSLNGRRIFVAAEEPDAVNSIDFFSR